jgi:hypothetical protein
MSQTELIIDPPIESCSNCTTVLVGVHCHSCGQRKIHANDFALKRFLARVVGDITDIESSKIFKTLRAMFTRPGLLATEYLAGRRGNYIGPIKLYLTFSAIYFLFAWGTLADIRGGLQRTVNNQFVINVALKQGVAPAVVADKIHERAEKYASALRFFSVLISGTFLAAFYFRMKKYYVEHLVFSLYYYSFDFFCKSAFALIFIVAAAVGWKLPYQVLNLFYPIALGYLLLALKRVYKQKWLITTVKAVPLFICEWLLFMAINIVGFIIAFATVAR